MNHKEQVLVAKYLANNAVTVCPTSQTAPAVRQVPVYIKGLGDTASAVSGIKL